MTRKPNEYGFWIPMDMWNLNELFTTESISPTSFYRKRDFGNPVNRNRQLIEDENNLILFNNQVQNDILLNVSLALVDLSELREIKTKGKTKVRSYEYPKTIYFRKGLIKVLFSSKELLNQFLNNSLMLLEVKTINKYKSELLVDESIRQLKAHAFFQTKIMSSVHEDGPYFDKAFNQVKGLLYGYMIGSISSLDEKEQNLLVELTTLKNAVAGIHTDIVLAEQYSRLWLISLQRLIKNCSSSYVANFGSESDVFSSLSLRLEEVDKLNRLRFYDLERQNSEHYKQAFQQAQKDLEKAKMALHLFGLDNELVRLREQLAAIKDKEERNGRSKGKKREYFKKGSSEYLQKQKLKKVIEEVEEGDVYKQLKNEVERQEEYIRSFQFGYTQYDTSITEQFSRMSEYLNEVTKRSSNYFLSKSNKGKITSDMSFNLNMQELMDCYKNGANILSHESITLPASLRSKLATDESMLVTKVLSVLLKMPQGLLGSYSEQNILDAIKHIGEQLEENEPKKVLREYYLYRIGKSDVFSFPENHVLANLIVFLMKGNGHEQINKSLVSKGVANKELAFLFYGAYVGFANMPKTFTNIVFDSENRELFDDIDAYLFSYLANY